MQAAKRIVVDGPLDLRFQSVRSGAWVETRGRIAWRSEDGMVAGVELVDPSPETVREVRRWLSFGASLEELQGDWEDTAASGSSPVAHRAESRDGNRGQGFAVRASDSAPPQANAETLTISRSASFSRGWDRSAPRSRIVPISAFTVLALVIVSVVLAAARRGALVPIWRPSLKNEAPVEQALPPAQVDLAAEKKTVSAGPATPTPTNPAKTTPDGLPVPEPEGSGLVLQVAAMNDPENANGLARSLRLKNLPAFVSKRESDRFYRVLVGPYQSEPSLRKAKSTLEGEHIPAIERRWSR